MSNYVYKIRSNIVSDTMLVVADTPINAIIKYILYWGNSQNKEIRKENITYIENIGEAITNGTV